MADTKISALTAATTPLAGTEVLPVVQSGVTKQVSVANLTAGRAVSASSLSLTNALTAANGGTGLSSFTSGGVVYASSTSALTTGTALQFNGKIQGIGAAPSTWFTTYNGLQVNTVGSIISNTDFFAFSNNVLVDGSANETFLTSNYAMRYRQVATTGKHEWYSTAASGTAGNAATLVLAATLFPSGGLSLGNTTDPGAGNLNVNGSTLKVGTTSLYNSSANIGTFSWSSATNVGGEGAYVFVNTSTSANSDPNPILAIHKGSTTTSSSARFIQFFANGAAQAMGGIVGNGATNVQFVSLSDEREKENIQPVTGALDRLMQIQVCSFDRKGGGDHVKAGFIAQNVLPVYPEYVVENAANANDDPRYGITGGMSAGYVAELTAAIQEQQIMINDLKQKLEQYIAKN